MHNKRFSRLVFGHVFKTLCFFDFSKLQYFKNAYNTTILVYFFITKFGDAGSGFFLPVEIKKECFL
ncbi:MAG: hypothetical protein DCE86_11930 [Flavobacteriaceae bacterium]|nr:MAG: hypothetical protein DCE86_11930 [Flavobacteriaceae bacterium]